MDECSVCSIIYLKWLGSDDFFVPALVILDIESLKDDV